MHDYVMFCVMHVVWPVSEVDSKIHDNFQGGLSVLADVQPHVSLPG
jgi:hypothetical protein